MSATTPSLPINLQVINQPGAAMRLRFDNPDAGSKILQLLNDQNIEVFAVTREGLLQLLGSTVMGIHSLDLGSPAAASPTAIHAAVALTGSAQLGIAATHQPKDTGATYGRTVSITTSFPGDDGVADKVTVHSHNPDGTVISEDLPYTDATGETVSGVKAHYGTLTFDLPAKGVAAAGTISVGTGSRLGLGRLFVINTLLQVFQAGQVQAGGAIYDWGSGQLCAIDATHVEANTLFMDKFNGADGTAFAVVYYA